MVQFFYFSSSNILGTKSFAIYVRTTFIELSISDRLLIYTSWMIRSIFFRRCVYFSVVILLELFLFVEIPLSFYQFYNYLKNVFLIRAQLLFDLYSENPPFLSHLFLNKEVQSNSFFPRITKMWNRLQRAYSSNHYNLQVEGQALPYRQAASGSLAGHRCQRQ